MLKDGVKHASERHRIHLILSACKLLADALGVLMNVTGITPDM